MTHRPHLVETDRDRGLRERLEQQRDLIRRQVRDRIRQVSETSAEAANLEEFALSDVVDDLDLALASLHSETLQKIEDALDRLAAGEYGYCTECGQEILARRLDALPFASRCRSCEETNEVRRTPRPPAVTHHHPACLS